MDGLLDDDFDPLAPVHVADPSNEVGEEEAANSIADPQRIVRLWFEDGRLTRVSVSPIWHRKLGEHRTLGTAFAAALAAARIRIAEPEELPEPDLDGVDFSGLWRFGPDPFTTFQLALENVNQRWQAAAQRHLEHPPAASEPVSVVQEGALGVRLDEQGHLVAVEFDEDWLDEADVREINDGVLRLAQQAYARYVAPSDAAGELAAITREHEILMAGLRRMVTGRDPA
ncbi:hypothetical protein [Tessaracoccus sp. ZS01]|uniref:hypothetical protein n=1 Tax=Tessaracoccus sp. ZS01 TaxID=1906324 RepID=UPI00096D899A|nr:hypothetical protein [Tessaracoccus sp. ZS01]MCG6567365.1 hypothetical protein [Tessaracoccus sp. ZS01]OMG56940.1 hypothetical protein BJN44_06995 [Tessaracoccus sp. ZS01]